MPPTSLNRSAILLITALILVQGAAALTIEQAPLNPEFVAYTEGLDTGDNQFSTECCGDSYTATGTYRMPYATGDIPAPVVMVWPDTYPADLNRAAEADGETFPTRFDLRDSGRVTPVRDQGKCGSCWAFAAYGSLESTYLTDTGTAEDFSENNMKNLLSNLYPDGFDYGPCDGGNAYMSTAYLTRGSGPIREADDPYILPIPSNVSPTDLPPVLDTHEVTFLPTRTGPLDNDLLKQTLKDEGAIRVRFLVNRTCFSYNGITYYLPEEGHPPEGGHAVTLVGWNDTFPKENFAITPPGDGAFILKNSWGTYFGEDGYFYISYYDRSLDTGEPALFTGVPADTDRRIYQYDPLGATMHIGTGTDTTYCAANVFTAGNYEALTDVSFYTIEPDTDYTVAIFTNFTTPPGDAAPVAWTSGTSALPGYHTISLPETVTLMPGEVFSVVLEITSPTSVYPLAVEWPIPGYSSKATAGPGESYVSDDGSTWEDLTTDYPNTNVCIKAFTTPLTVVPWDYPTIMEAVNAAADGDTIIVESGTYPEALSLYKNVTLTGVGMPVVTTPEGVETGAMIWTDNITLTGFSFEGNEEWSRGISVYGNNYTMSDCRCTGYQTGIFIGLCKGLYLSETSLYNNDYNLLYTDYLENPGNTIAETVTVNGKPVIYRESISGETIDASSDAGAVICVNCTDMIIRDITTEPVECSIFLLACQDVIVEHVTANAAYYGVRAYKSENITVRDSSFGPDMESCIKMDQISRALAEGNEIACHEYGMGIELRSAENTTVSDNTITSGGVGVIGSSSNNCSISGNTISDCHWGGILTSEGDTLAVTNNTVDNSGTGIYTWDMRDIRVSDNTIRCNNAGNGMSISADGAVINGNTADNCTVQANMELNNSEVYGNHFSGAAYPVMKGLDTGENVYVYRNDFVLTDGILFGSILSDSAAADVFDRLSMDDVLLDETSPTGEFREMSAKADTSVGALQTDAANIIWHSPTEETYWYYGRAFTQTMGNYWSTYNGTDTTHDGIGETPFMIRNNETDICPLVNPAACYFNKNPLPATDEDASADMATSPALSAGESATLRFTGSAVQAVTVTAKENTGRILLAVDRAGNGPDGLAGPVYQYLSAQLNGMTDDEISEADFSFRVPNAWLKAEKLLPAEITLWRFHDGVWQDLPTSLVREENGWVYYEAVSPGFSSFAIAAGDGQKVAVTTDAAVPGDAGTDTVDVSVTVAPGNETASKPPVTVAVPEEEDTVTPTGTTTQESPLGLLAIIGGAGMVAALLSRKQ
ncbi:lectin like domain-containing protein [Methanogenium sp. MK-MG]|uniref:lectin like domain-containing protein n=1 Tax=Methanogenium sp. MK-MG TaxID=2599926 RepID=UPI0013EA4111|nr:lectin like domain-containing protein [Methanogenium sp. MK-MG]KAF1074509.1 hypothetical protein MKMG_01928 [Methanogenium sp. MK-MG]